MAKSKGFPHEKVINWRVRDNFMLADVGWPYEVREEFGDLEERVKGQKIFKSGGVKQGWEAQNVVEKPEHVSRTYIVKSVSRKGAKQYTVEIPLILNKESGKYRLPPFEFISHTCEDDIYGRRIYRNLPRIPGPDQHVIAALLFAQQAEDIEPKYGEVFPDDFVELCDKLDTYYKGDYTTVFRREIKYVVNAVMSGDKRILRRFSGKKPKIVLQHRARQSYKAKIIAEPDETGTSLTIKYGKKGSFAVHTDVPYQKFQQTAIVR
jgi:hypothetical protein